MKNYLFFLLLSIMFNPQAKAITQNVIISKSGAINKNIIDAFLNSTILENYWAGDDGVSCDEPYLDIQEINYQSQKISFKVSLNGQKMECHEQNFKCSVDFSETSTSILVSDTSIDCPFD